MVVMRVGSLIVVCAGCEIPRSQTDVMVGDVFRIRELGNPYILPDHIRLWAVYSRRLSRTKNPVLSNMPECDPFDSQNFGRLVQYLRITSP